MPGNTASSGDAFDAHLTGAPRWGLGEAAAGFVAGLVLGNLLLGIWVAVFGESDSVGAVAASLVGLWTGLLGAVVLATRRRGSGSLARDFGLRFKRPADLLGLPLGALSQYVLIPLVYLPLLPLIPDLAERLDAPSRDLAERAGSDAAFALLAVLVIIGAPIVEEVFYRGLLLRALQRRIGTRGAVVISSVVFAFAHLQPLLIPAFIVFGLVLAIAAVRTNRLGTCILAHATFNALTVAFLVTQR